MAKRYGIIYKHTCLLSEHTNGIYIGKTLATNPNKRWANGYGYLRYINDNQYSNTKMINTILKYGIKNWNNTEVWLHEVIESNIPEEKLSEREIFWISFYDSYSSGLNSTCGGDGATNREYSKQTIEKMKQSANNRAKQLYIYDSVSFKLLRVYPSISEAAKAINNKCISAVKNCIDKPWRKYNNMIFMKTLLTKEDIIQLIIEHKQLASTNHSKAAMSTSNLRQQTIIKNKQNSGYKKATYDKLIIVALNCITNKEQYFETKIVCMKALQISKYSFYKYCDSNAAYKNYIIYSKLIKTEFKRTLWIKDNKEKKANA